MICITIMSAEHDARIPIGYVDPVANQLWDVCFKFHGGVEKHRVGTIIRSYELASSLRAEAVKGLALTLEGVHDVQSGAGLPAGMLSVGDRITDDGFEEGLEDATSLLVHHTGDALDATTTSQTADCGLRDALDVVTHHLAVALGTRLANTFSFAGHGCYFSNLRMNCVPNANHRTRDELVFWLVRLIYNSKEINQSSLHTCP